MTYGYFRNRIARTSEFGQITYNISILRGYGVYEFAKCINGIPFMLAEHLQRLHRSLEIMKVKFEQTPDFSGIIHSLIEKNKVKDSFIKIIVSPELSKSGDYCLNEPGVYIWLEDYKPPEDSLSNCGAKLISKEYARFLPEAKSTSYIASVYYSDEVKKCGAVDVVFKDSGLLRETSRCNIFFIKDSIVYTPGNKMLEGITRRCVIDILKNSGIELVIDDIPENFPHTADEMFITSTTRQIQPIINLDGKTIGTGKPGEITKFLQNEYIRLLNTICRQHQINQ